MVVTHFTRVRIPSVTLMDNPKMYQRVIIKKRGEHMDKSATVVGLPSATMATVELRNGRQIDVENRLLNPYN